MNGNVVEGDLSGCAVVLPCLDEEKALEIVLMEAKEHLPGVSIYVFDNDSTDQSVKIAKRNRAEVVRVSRKGKGNVIRKALSTIEQSVIVLADADGTYSFENLASHIQKVKSGEFDMLIGNRFSNFSPSSFTTIRLLGNKFFSSLCSMLFFSKSIDVLSGLRVINRKKFESFNLTSEGFAIETEMCLVAARAGLKIASFDTVYGARPEGSFSKLHFFRDGCQIIVMFFRKGGGLLAGRFLKKLTWLKV